MPLPKAKTPEELAKIHAAFTEVFGVNGMQRTAAQVLVLATLKDQCYANKPIFVADAQGKMCPIRAALTEGKRSVWIALDEEISFR